MKKPTPPWWIEFILKYWSGLLGLGALIVAVIVFVATLSPRLSAAEKKNVLQDEAILELKKSNEIWQDIYQRQQSPNRPQGLREWDGTDEVFWCCPITDREQCYAVGLWQVCE